MTSPDAKAELQTGRAATLDGSGLRIAIACGRFNDFITERVPSVVAVNPENIAYMRTKRERMGHLLEGLDDVL